MPLGDLHTHRNDAIAAVELVKNGSVRYDALSSVNGHWFFRITASNGRILAASETYVNKQDATSAANLVARYAAEAPFFDLAA